MASVTSLDKNRILELASFWESLASEQSQLQADLAGLNADLAGLQSDLGVLNNETLPALQTALANNDIALAALNDNVLPGLNDALAANNETINILNTVTIPDLEALLNDNTSNIQNLNDTTLPELYAKFPITETDISDGAITTPKIFAGAVTAEQIAANTITANEIATDAITADEIAARTITALEIATDTITANEIHADSITADEIASRTITANEIAVGAITANEIHADTITANEIATDAITANELAADSVIANKIKAGEVVAGKLATDSVLANNIKAGEVVAGKLAAGSVAALNIQAGAVTTEKLTIATFSDNRVMNGGFEETQAADATQPANWSQNGITGTSAGSLDTVNSYSGARAFKIVNAANGGMGIAGNYIPVSAGQSWYLSVITKASSAAAGFYFRAYWYDSNKVALSGTPYTDLVAAGAFPTTYTKYEYNPSIPSGAKYMVLSVLAWNTASAYTAYFDEVVAKLQTVGAQIANGAIDGKTVTAALIRSAAGTGRRIVMDGTTAVPFFGAYDASNRPTVSIDGVNNVLTGTLKTGFSTDTRVEIIGSGLWFYEGSTNTGLLGVGTGGFPGMIWSPQSGTAFWVFQNNGPLAGWPSQLVGQPVIQLNPTSGNISTAGNINQYSTAAQTILAGLADGGSYNTNAGAKYVRANASGGLTASTTAPSSRELKTEIKPLRLDPDQILKMQPKTYFYKEDLKNLRVGFIAEEVHELGLTPLVGYEDHEDSTKPTGFDYDGLGAALLLVAQKQQKQIDRIMVHLGLN